MTACDLGAITKPWPIQKKVYITSLSNFQDDQKDDDVSQSSCSIGICGCIFINYFYHHSFFQLKSSRSAFGLPQITL